MDGREADGGERDDLVQRCLRDDGEAWSELVLLFEAVAVRPLRRILIRCRFDASLAEEVVADLWCSLLDNERRRLTKFQGSSRRDLEGWLVRVAINFTWNWTRESLSDRRREQQALAQVKVPDRGGPGERELSQLLRELESCATAQDICRLRILTGQRKAAEAIPARTLRCWATELRRRHFALHPTHHTKPRNLAR